MGSSHGSVLLKDDLDWIFLLIFLKQYLLHKSKIVNCIGVLFSQKMGLLPGSVLLKDDQDQLFLSVYFVTRVSAPSDTACCLHHNVNFVLN